MAVNEIIFNRSHLCIGSINIGFFVYSINYGEIITETGKHLLPKKINTATIRPTPFYTVVMKNVLILTP